MRWVFIVLQSTEICLFWKWRVMFIINCLSPSTRSLFCLTEVHVRHSNPGIQHVKKSVLLSFDCNERCELWKKALNYQTFILSSIFPVIFLLFISLNRNDVSSSGFIIGSLIFLLWLLVFYNWWFSTLEW